MISSVPIHHNSFTNELMWRTHFPVKQESLDDSGSNISPEVYADTEQDPDHDLDQHKSHVDHLARFIPPTISTSPSMPSHQGIYLSPTYQQREVSAHFRASPSRVSPYARSSPHHKTSPTFHSPNSILSSPSPGSFFQKISPSGCDLYRASTPDKARSSPGRHADLYRTSPNISADFHRISPTSHISGTSSSFGSDPFLSPHSYSHVPPTAMGPGMTPNDIYRSLNFNVPKTNDPRTISPRPNLDEPLNMNSKAADLSLSQETQRFSPQSNGCRQQLSPNHARASPSSVNPRISPHHVSSEHPLSPPSLSNHESNDSIDDSRSPSPVQNLKMVLKKSSTETFWDSNNTAPEAPASCIETTNDVPSLKCYFCSYNTKSRIQLNKHMRDAHTESKIMPNQYNKESNENESEDDNENETHSNLSEDFMMDEYDDEDVEGEELSVNMNKVSQNANSNKRTSYKCKKCALTFKNKDEYYVHQKDNHIKREKLLECKLCPFVTEYKHHHEYHIKNHFKMKPFKCSYSNCKYSCNNQSMLNSHVKSHKSFYQFHCKNCNYATKYMHSFKLHLRKNNHEKGITLNEDGSVNNDIIIDIHGTRRGPKRKSRKLDDNALQNINNNNSITQTIKKTIHHEPEAEYNNNVTMSSNNGSSRSNSPISNVNFNNNNNNESYYLNTKLFVYSHMASMINDKTPEIWAKDTNTLVENFKQFNKNHDDTPEVVDLSESIEESSDMQLDTEAPLDLTKSVDIKPRNTEALQNSEFTKVAVQFNGKPKPNHVESNQSLIKIENKVKTSADMIKIVGKNNYNIAQGNVFKNKNRIKLCKNNEKSIKNALEKKLRAENELKAEINARNNNNHEMEVTDHFTNQSTPVERPLIPSQEKLNEDRTDEIKTGNCDTVGENRLDKVNEIRNENAFTAIDDDAVSAEQRKTAEKEITAMSEANKQAISTNKNRRRKGKAYKLQINNDYLVDETDDSVNEELRDENTVTKPVTNTPKPLVEDVTPKMSNLPSSYEAMQMDYLKQIQNQYFKTFQQTKCLENCAVPLLPPTSQHNAILSNINNNVNSSQIFDAKSQILSNYPQHDFVGSHLKNLERINSHLLQNSLNIPSRHKSEGLKAIDNFLNKKNEARNNLLNPFMNKSNDIGQNVNNRLWYKCELCDIQYLDELIYSIHMRYHNVEHPYKCNLCGLQTSNKFQFNLHIIQTPH